MVSGVLQDKHAGAGLPGQREGRSNEELWRGTQGMVVPVGLGIVLIIGLIHAAYDKVYSPKAEFHSTWVAISRKPQRHPFQKLRIHHLWRNVETDTNAERQGCDTCRTRR